MGSGELAADGDPGWGDCDRDLLNLDVNTERSVGASLWTKGSTM